MTTKSVASQKKLPLWLKRLDLVKTEAKATRWPKEEEGFRQGIELLALGLQLIEKSGEKEKLLTEFAKCDARWAARWRKERAKAFPRSSLKRPS